MSEYKTNYDKAFQDFVDTNLKLKMRIAELEKAILEIDGGHSYNDTFLKIDEAVSLVNEGKL